MSNRHYLINDKTVIYEWWFQIAHYIYFPSSSSRYVHTWALLLSGLRLSSTHIVCWFCHLLFCSSFCQTTIFVVTIVIEYCCLVGVFVALFKPEESDTIWTCNSERHVYLWLLCAANRRRICGGVDTDGRMEQIPAGTRPVRHRRASGHHPARRHQSGQDRLMARWPARDRQSPGLSTLQYHLAPIGLECTSVPLTVSPWVTMNACRNTQLHRCV